MTFKRIIQLEGLRTEDEFYSYMENNMSDVYHWKVNTFNICFANIDSN
jgi:hypothetical protein